MDFHAGSKLMCPKLARLSLISLSCTVSGCALIGVWFTLQYCNLPDACGVSGHVVYSSQFGGIDEISQHGDGPLMLSSTDTARGIAFADVEGELRLYVATDSGLMVFDGHSKGGRSLTSFSPPNCEAMDDVAIFNGHFAVVSCLASPKLIKIDLDSLSVVEEFACCEGVPTTSVFSAIAITPENNVLSGAGFISLFDGTTGEFIRVAIPAGVNGATRYNDLLFGPNGNLFVSADASVGVLEFDGDSLELLRVVVEPTAEWTSGFTGLAFTEEGHLLVGTADDGVILKSDPSNGTQPEVFNEGGIPVNYIAIRP